MASADNEMYQQVLLEHARSPRNFQELPSATSRAEGFNRLCGDRITVYLIVKNETVVGASFSGESCAICKGTASMMLLSIKDQPLVAVRGLIDAFKEFQVAWQNGDPLMKDFEALAAIKEYPTRLKCLNLPWKTLEAAMQGTDDEVSTE